MQDKEKTIGSIVIVVACLIFLGVGCFMTKSTTFDENIECKNKHYSGKISSTKDEVIVDNTNTLNKKINDEIKNIVVEIKGEVKNPSVYTIKYGSRVDDLVKKAGGFTDKADKMSVNCSMKLKDEDSIVIYNKEESNVLKNKSSNTSRNIVNSNTKSNDKININTATKEELKTLPSVGDVTAENIIEYREKNGRFNSIEDITKVQRIGSKTFEKFKDKISS